MYAFIVPQCVVNDLPIQIVCHIRSSVVEMNWISH